MSFYNNDVNKYKEFFSKLKIADFKKIVFVSENDKNIFLKYFQEYQNKCIQCNNLIDYEKIKEKAKEDVKDFKVKENITTFINIGRHDEKQKKLSRIINATKRLNKEGYIFRVIFVGNGPDTEMYREQANDVQNIEFLGAKKNPYPYLKNSDCLIMSSDFEGYPVVFIESLILGKTIITTDVSDSKKDIKDKFGLVVDKSEDGIYNGMKQYLEKGFSTKTFNPKEFNENILKKLEKIMK